MRSFVFLLILQGTFLLNAQDRIAYLSNQGGNFDIYIMEEGEAMAHRLTDNPGWDWNPKWIPGLKSILYYSNDTARNFSIRMMTIKGKALPYQPQDLKEYVLSPDGQKVLYTHAQGDFRYISIFRIIDGSSEVLIQTPSYNGRPMWSPDSQTFSFLSDRSGNTELYVYKLESGESIRLTESEKREKYTSWHPDGKRIFYTYHYSDEKDKEHNDIFSVDIESGAIRQITDDLTFYQEIAVSPKGDKIAFHGKREGKDHIFIMDIDGKNERQLSQVDAYHGEPEWIPGRY
ncbi:MAG: hypothetical protein R8P61_33215 [Bacteroidia bacterium]|nr:hypothetical protein [Bacteroidia bacterium]